MVNRPVIEAHRVVRSDAGVRQLHILQHSLCVDQHGQGEQRRPQFITGAESDDHSDCMALFEAGLMKRRANVEMYGGMDAFFVTDEGRAFVAANSMPPPKLTRSQRRYQAWLDADCNLTFIDYCRRAGAGASA